MAWRAALAASWRKMWGTDPFKIGHRLTWFFFSSPLYRTSSQKPGDDLLANFRQQFPEVAVGSSAAASASQTATAGNAGIVAPGQERYVLQRTSKIIPRCLLVSLCWPYTFVVVSISHLNSHIPPRHSLHASAAVPVAWFHPEGQRSSLKVSGPSLAGRENYPKSLSAAASLDLLGRLNCTLPQ